MPAWCIISGMEIDLGNGKKALVCDCHAHLVKDMSWHYNARYAMHSKRVGERKLNKTIHVKMHHLVGGTPPQGMEADHINRDSLDNRCSNLRFVTAHENLLNRKTFKNSKSGIKGVSILPNGKWRVRRKINGRLVYLGTFNTIEEAKEAFLGGVERPA